MSIENPCFKLIDPSFWEYDEIDKFILDQQSVKTKYATKYGSNTFKKFCQSINEQRAAELIPPSELNAILCQFFMNVKKLDGKEYEPDTLTSIHRSLQRYLNEKKTDVNILTDPDFQQSRNVLAAKRKQLTKLGYGNKPNATRELEEDEIEKLYQTGFFGKHDAHTLQKTMWWLISLHFGFRARDEARKLRWGDIVYECDQEKGECIVLIRERGTKTRTGKENQEKRFYNPTAYATGTDRCPVSYYKEFRNHRPSEALKEDSPFFLALKQKVDYPKNTIWYLKTPLGKNKIGEFLSKKYHSLEGKVANHSVRKTSIGRLLDANIPEVYVAQHSGHKNIDSLKSYKAANKTHRFEMSHILSSSKKDKINPLNTTPKSSSTISSKKQVSCDVSTFTSFISGGNFNNCSFNFTANTTTPLAKRQCLELSKEL